ncbi:MAG: S9 family peptidase [Planctomycetota bacterium]|nr:S9 family peptidase [Planctomycetota bacterium]
MRATQAVVCFALLVTGLFAQQARQLEPIDMFRLPYFALSPSEEPHGWLDANQYLVFDPGRPAVQGPRNWYTVDARSGEREMWIERAAIAKALTGFGVAKEDLEALDDDSHWLFSEDHQRFVLDLANDLFTGTPGGELRRLTDTPDQDEEIVLFSPSGDRVSFVRDYNLYVMSLETGEEVAITKDGHADRFFGKLDWVYQEEVFGRGNFVATWWSPDGQHVAFLDLDESPVKEFTLVSDTPARPEMEVTNYPKAGEDNPKVWLCVAPAEGGEIKRFDLSAYPEEDRLIVRVTWTPDSKELFFQVTDRQQTWLDMLAADVATGQVRQVFRETSDCWVEPGPEPRWISDEQFLWVSERDGYRHIYRYSRDGSELGRLTSGEWLVQEVVAVDTDNEQVWFLANRSSPLQKQLYRVPLAGGEIKQVTEGRGYHSVEMAPGCALFLDEWSSIADPPREVVMTAEGEEVRAISLPKMEVMAPYDLQPVEFLQVPTRDGFAMEAMIIKPVGYEEGKAYPVVQFTYSGPHAPRVRDRWMSRDYIWHQLLAQRGYLVFVCDNRSASGKGRKYAKACWRDLGSSELRDLEDSVKWLVEKGYGEADRIGIWGWSYGGYQTLYNMTHSKAWKCGIAVNAVTDWRNYDTIYTERYMGLPDENKEGYARSSVLDAAPRLSGPLLLVAAVMDDNVHMQNSLQFLYQLQMAGKDCDFMLYPRVRHGIESLEQQIHLFRRMLAFWQENL